MHWKRVPTCATAEEAEKKGIAFGAADERTWLDKYFRVGSGSGDKPYYMPGTGEWVQERYPDRSLQRRRKDFEDSLFFHPSRESWAFRPGAAKLASDRLLPEKGARIPLVALMSWMWRQRELVSLSDALEEFKKEFHLAEHGFIGQVYEDGVPVEFDSAGLSISPLAEDEISELTGGTPLALKPQSIDTLVKAISDALVRDHLLVPPGLIERVIGGWLVQDIVVLVGSTGSGKTSFARAIGNALQGVFGEERFLTCFLEITPQVDISQFLGYENLSGSFVRGAFSENVLFCGTPGDPRLVVLDEWNLAQIDAYFAPVLTAIESRIPMHIPGRLQLEQMGEVERGDLLRAQPDASEGQWRLPEDTFFIATCNSWQEEPESRLPISGPVKRRCRIISMPNALELAFKSNGRDGLTDYCNALLAQEAASVQKRRSAGRGSVLDQHREERLMAIDRISKLPIPAVTGVLTLAQILLSQSSTKSGFTPGILKDILLSIVYTPPGREMEALGQAIADKVLHQLHGDSSVLRILRDRFGELPNFSELSDLMQRMDGGGAERRIRPIV